MLSIAIVKLLKFSNNVFGVPNEIIQEKFGFLLWDLDYAVKVIYFIYVLMQSYNMI